MQAIRITLSVVFWLLTLTAFFWGIAFLARIFTGDDAFGAYDGFQFVGALYGAIYRFVAAFVFGSIVVRLLRWKPGAND